jgi:chromosomal replication initiation ATPase DnaA
VTNPIAIRRAEPNTGSIKLVRLAVANVFGFPEPLLDSKTRIEPLNTRRQLAMTLARELTSAGLAEIARAFGKKDHMTVSHAVRATHARLETDPTFATQATSARVKAESLLRRVCS